MSRRLLPLTLFLFVVAVPSVAQNAVTNGSFDSDLAAWSNVVVDSTIEWSDLDADGNDDSGSLKVTNIGWSSPASNAAGAFQVRIPVAENRRYLFRFFVLFPPDQSDTAEVTAYLQFYATHGATFCETLLATYEVADIVAADSWQESSVVGWSPLEATCAMVTLITSKGSSRKEFRTYFDEVELEALLFADGFEFGTLQAWQ